MLKRKNDRKNIIKGRERFAIKGEVSEGLLFCVWVRVVHNILDEWLELLEGRGGEGGSYGDREGGKEGEEKRKETLWGIKQ